MRKRHVDPHKREHVLYWRVYRSPMGGIHPYSQLHGRNDVRILPKHIIFLRSVHGRKSQQHDSDTAHPNGRLGRGRRWLRRSMGRGRGGRRGYIPKPRPSHEQRDLCHIRGKWRERDYMRSHSLWQEWRKLYCVCVWRDHIPGHKRIPGVRRRRGGWRRFALWFTWRLWWRGRLLSA